MNNAFSTHPLPVPAMQRTPECCIATSLASDAHLSGDPAQHAAPRRQPGSSAVTLRAGCGRERIQCRFPHPPSRADVARSVPTCVPVSDQPVGRCNRCGDRCVRLTQTGRLIADVSGTFGRRTGQHDDNVPELGGVPCNSASLNEFHRSFEMSHWSGVALARDASDQGSGVERTEGVQSPHLNCPTVLIAGGVGQHGDAPLSETGSHEIASVETFCREVVPMGIRGPGQYLTDAVMDEAEEAEDAATAFVRTVQRAIADGRVTDDEVLDIRVGAARVVQETRDVVMASERASIAQRMADNIQRGGIAESTRLRARDAGLIVPDFRIDMPQDAA